MSKYDSRNKLNNLTGQEWLKLTASFWVSEKCKEDKEAMRHPAPFLIKDIEKLISLFTKVEMTILDMFCGSGTALIAACNLNRQCIGVDLNQEYKKLALKRLNLKGYEEDKDFIYLVGDAVDTLKNIPNVDYIVTSPPYYNILKNDGGGTRVQKDHNKFRSGSRIGVEYYSNDKNDLGNKETYIEFLEALKDIMKLGYNKLNHKKYCTIIISDFTVDKKEINVQSDIVKIMTDIGFEFSGTTILLQPNKPLYPFGYPYAYKINHHHQNIITFRKI